MGNRRQKRVKTVLPVRLGGVDSRGKRFAAVAHTMDISYSGARIGGVVADVLEGEIVDLQYRHRRAKFTVSWARRNSTDLTLGLRAIDPTKDLWGASLESEDCEDVYEPPKKFACTSTRKMPRYQANASVDMLTIPSLRAASAELQNISTGGCYLKSFSPFDAGTRVELLIQLDGMRINAFGIVRSSHPGRGMGLQFTEFRTAEDKMALQAKIAELAGEEVLPQKQKRESDLSQRLQAVTKELYQIEESLKTAAIEPNVLREFRESVGQVRSTSWALQKSFEVEDDAEPGMDVTAFLNTERIRLATRVCRHLCDDLRRHEIDRQSPHLADLLESVEDLFTGLAGFEFKIVDYGVRKRGAS
jgi:hypothetical protein